MWYTVSGLTLTDVNASAGNLLGSFPQVNNKDGELSGVITKDNLAKAWLILIGVNIIVVVLVICLVQIQFRTHQSQWKALKRPPPTGNSLSSTALVVRYVTAETIVLKCPLAQNTQLSGCHLTIDALPYL